MKTIGVRTINQREDSMPGCVCGEKSNIYVFSCSGAADVGALSDQVARKMSKDARKCRLQARVL
jgi:uncharacterized metal-binding protein